MATQALLLGGDVAKKPRTWPGKSGKYEKYSIQFENNTGQMRKQLDAIKRIPYVLIVSDAFTGNV